MQHVAYNRNDKEKRIHSLEESLRYYKNKDSSALHAFCSGMEMGERLADLLVYYGEIRGSERGLMDKGASIIQEYLGTPYRLGLLTKRLDFLLGGAIDSLDEDYPKLGTFEKNLFCHILLDIPNSVIAFSLGLRDSHAVSCEKYRLVSQIQSRYTPARKQLLELLEKSKK